MSHNKKLKTYMTPGLIGCESVMQDWGFVFEQNGIYGPTWYLYETPDNKHLSAKDIMDYRRILPRSRKGFL
jgi:hypothetical protein